MVDSIRLRLGQICVNATLVNSFCNQVLQPFGVHWVVSSAPGHSGVGGHLRGKSKRRLLAKEQEKGEKPLLFADFSLNRARVGGCSKQGAKRGTWISKRSTKCTLETCGSLSLLHPGTGRWPQSSCLVNISPGFLLLLLWGLKTKAAPAEACPRLAWPLPHL